MRLVLSIVILVAALGAGAWFFLLRGDSAMSEAEVTAFLSERASQINGAEGGERFDDFSRLVSATAVERQITIRGDSTLNADTLNDDWIDSRRAQAANRLCNDETTRRAMAGRATHVFNWFSADDQHMGMVTIRGDAICAEFGF